MKKKKTLRRMAAIILTIALMCGGNAFALASAKDADGVNTNGMKTVIKSAVVKNEGLSEMEETETDSWFSFKAIKPLQAGETATVKLVVNKTICMNSWFIDILFNDEKVEFVPEKDTEGEYKFQLYKNLKGWNAGNYLEDSKEVKLAGAYTETSDNAKIPAGTVFVSLTIKAKVDLAAEDVVATLAKVSFTDDVQALDENITDEEKCIVQENVPNDRIMGDVDGDGVVGTIDALYILMHVANPDTLHGEALEAADMDGDTLVTVFDALYVLQKVAG